MPPAWGRRHPPARTKILPCTPARDAPGWRYKSRAEGFAGQGACSRRRPQNGSGAVQWHISPELAWRFAAGSRSGAKLLLYMC